jgi:hypothetical protein
VGEFTPALWGIREASESDMAFKRLTLVLVKNLG